MFFASLVRAALIFMLLSIATLAGCSGGADQSSLEQPTGSAPPAPQPPPPTNTVSESDVVFGTGLLKNGSKSLLLDIYQPDDPCTDKRPFVVGIHGGGFVGGSKSGAVWVDIMEAISQKGFVALSIDYRLIGDEPVVSAEFQPVLDALNEEADRLGVPSGERVLLNAVAAATEDAVTALRWARDNSNERCLDIDRFALWGASAGAITALHVAHGTDEYFIDHPAPVVVVDYWGRMYLNGLLDAEHAPLLIIHGTSDDTLNYEETAVVLAEEAEAIGLPHSFYTIENGPHGFASVSADAVQINGQDPLEFTIDFIEDHLAGNAPAYENQTIVHGN